MRCSAKSRTLCELENCHTCFQRSFASHEKASCWSEQNTIKSRQVFKGNSSTDFLFKCETCNHTFSALLSNVTKPTNPRWCPYCAKPVKKLCEDENCKMCFDKSFASHEKAKYWSSKNKENPRNIIKGSGKEYLFECTKCNHTYTKALNKISIRGCPFCCYPPQQLCDDENCKHCFNNSFASSRYAKYWSYANNETPRQVFKGSGIKYDFVCKNNHRFEKSPNSIEHSIFCAFC